MNGQIRLTVAAGLATLLTTSALAPLWETLDWLRFALAATAAVTLSGVLMRRLSVPPGVVPLVNLAALLLLISVVFGRDHLAGVVPTGDTVAALRQQLHGAFSDVQQLTVPVPSRRGLLLLAVLGVGLVAVVVDLLAVTARHVALAGLPLLAMYAVPTAIARGSVGWLPFVLGACGYLLLLITDQRDQVSGWGRPFSTQQDADGWRPDPALPSPLAAAGRRIGAAALGLALVIPLLLPGLGTGGLYRAATGQGVGVGPGRGGSAGVLNPMTVMRGQLHRDRPVDLMRVRTDDRSPFYLRATALDVWHGNGWTQDRLRRFRSPTVSDGLPRAPIPDGVPKKDVKAQVEVTGLDSSRYLPVYASPIEVRAEGDWRFDRRTGTVFSTKTNTRDMRYAFRSLAYDSNDSRLRRLMERSGPAPAEELRAYGLRSVPVVRGVNQIVRNVLTQANATTPYQKVFALNAYFHSNGFTYDLNTKPGTSDDDVLDFLRGKQGYCEQYASAMALMARYADVPARVAIGYVRGEWRFDHWSVSSDDAHAWVEVYFTGVGWVPWDPTPRPSDAGPGNAADLPYAAASDGGAASAADAAAGATSDARQGERQNRLRPAETEPAAAPSPPSRREPTGAVLLAAAVLGAVGLLPAGSRAVLREFRRRRGRRTDPGAAHANWDELLATATDLGVPAAAADTPRGAVAGLVRQAGLTEPAASAAHRLARAEERARYAPSPGACGDLGHDLRLVARALRHSRSWPRRMVATVLPLSILQAASRGFGTGVTTILDRLDLVLARLRRLILRQGTHPARSP